MLKDTPENSKVLSSVTSTFHSSDASDGAFARKKGLKRPIIWTLKISFEQKIDAALCFGVDDFFDFSGSKASQGLTRAFKAVSCLLFDVYIVNSFLQKSIYTIFESRTL